MEYKEACSEVYFILEHLNNEDKKKIPGSVINFFKENQDMLYKAELDPSKELKEQEIKDETKAFLQILNAQYFSTGEEKIKFIEEVNAPVNKTENQMFENNINEVKQNENIERKNTSVTVYKESKFKALLNKILKIFKIKK